MDTTLIIFLGFQVIFLFILLKVVPIRYWIMARFSGINVDFMRLLWMSIRRSPIKDIISASIVSTKAGLDIKLDDLEGHAMAGGNVINLVKGLVSAQAAEIELSFDQAKKADLQHMDLVDMVKAMKEKATSHHS